MSAPVECGKLIETGSMERCRYAKGHDKPCWRYLSVTKRRGYVPGTSPRSQKAHREGPVTK